MKRIVCFLFLMANVVGLAIAQSSDNLTRNVLVAFDDNEIVKPGEFQMELLKGALYDEKNENPWFSFVYTVTNRFTGKCNIFVNDREKLLAELYRVYEYADGLYFPKERFPCGSIRNYVKTGILTEAEALEIWSGNAEEK